MLDLLNNPSSDNERNVLNADLVVNNLKNTLKAFSFDFKVSYEVYRYVTYYYIKLTGDKNYNDLLELNKEIALALGIPKEEVKINRINVNEAEIKVLNMKREELSLKELLYDFKVSKDFVIALGLGEKDNIITYNFDKDKSLLVSGVSGSGKTNLFNNIIMNILINYPSNKMLILDSQGINYNLYSNVIEVVNEEEEIIKRIKLLRKEFEEKVKNNDKEYLIVFIDEIYEILKIDNSVKDDINYLLEVGSTYNVYLVISTDSILEDDTYDLFKKDNLSKISFYLTSRGEYNLFLDRVVSLSNNDAIYLNGDKKVNRLFIPLVKDEEIERVIEKRM